MAAVSIATPLASSRIFTKWFTFPEIIALAPIPLMTGALILGLWVFLARMPRPDARLDSVPFAGAVLIFVLGFTGLAYSFYPYVVPERLTIWQAASAPAMGMIGTLIGLVQMLQSLDDPSSIGPAMAVALLTTLYGAILAFLICGPIAEKLDRHGAEESANMAVIVDGVDSLVKGHNAVVIKDKLQARLAPKLRENDPKAA